MIKEAIFKLVDKKNLSFEEAKEVFEEIFAHKVTPCLLYTSPSPRDLSTSRMPSSA